MYNENAVIENTAKTLCAYMTETFGEGEFEIIFCDDGSLDGCADTVRALNLDGVKVIGYEKTGRWSDEVRTAGPEAGPQLLPHDPRPSGRLFLRTLRAGAGRAGGFPP